MPSAIIAGKSGPEKTPNKKQIAIKISSDSEKNNNEALNVSKI